MTLISNQSFDSACAWHGLPGSISSNNQGAISQMQLTLHHTPTGDADNDGTVGFADFLILSQNFGQPEAVWAQGDFDMDGEVAFSDFLGLSSNFGKVLAAPPVPEPNSGLVFAVGLGFPFNKQMNESLMSVKLETFHAPNLRDQHFTW